MKKECLVLLLGIFLFSFVTSANAVMPSSYNLNFEPNIEREYSFSFILDDDVANSEAYISGPLSDYAQVIEEKKVFGRILVKVKLKFPEKIDLVGLQKVRVGVKQKENSQGGIAIISDVGGIIFVRIPYPDKYAEGELEVSNANAGEDVNYKLVVYSRGEEEIVVKPKLEIINSENQIINTLYLDERKIKSNDETVYEDSLNTNGVLPGDYNLSVSLDYDEGKFIELSKIFRIGELKVNMLNHTSFVEKDKVQRFNIQVESLWNDEISGVYINGSVINASYVEFKTPTIPLKPWQVTNLIGFIDTNGLEGDSFKMQIDINYANKTTTEIVDVYFIKDYNLILIVSVSLTIIILFVILFLFIRKKRGLLKNE